MNRPGNQAASWRDDAGDDPAALVGRSRRACVCPSFKRGLREAVGDRDSHAVRSPASLRSAAPSIQREASRGDVPGEGTGRIPALRPSGDPRGRLSRLPRLIRPGVRAGAPSSPGAGFWRTELFLIAYAFWNHRPSLWKSSPGQMGTQIRDTTAAKRIFSRHASLPVLGIHTQYSCAGRLA